MLAVALDAGEIQVADGVAHVHAVGLGDIRVDDHLDGFTALVRLRESESAFRATGLAARFAGGLPGLGATLLHYPLDLAGVERDPGGSLVGTRERDPFPAARGPHQHHGHERQHAQRNQHRREEPVGPFAGGDRFSGWSGSTGVRVSVAHQEYNLEFSR